ncbi:MAG: S46 family peptidase, partial [Paludibacter sp.]|nr:S46 family peptidase [Paludibacter sp.]
ISQTLDDFATLYAEQTPYALANAYLNELLRNSETFYIANLYINFLDNYKSGKANEIYISNLKNRLITFYKDYDKNLDANVSAKILSIYANKMPQDFLPDNFLIYKNEKFNIEEIEKLWEKSIITGNKNFAKTTVNKDINTVFSNPEKLVKALKSDPVFVFVEKIKNTYLDKVSKTYSANQQKIASLQKRYMAQQMRTDTLRRFFPDANSTLRVAYGQIRGSEPSDGVEYHFETTLEGVMQKYVPNDYEFNVPEKFIKLYKSKDYGRYADASGKLPVNFTATNHTTGGNSGSPTLDAEGNLIGLNFDRQWEGTMSDLNFDPQYCRNIMVSTKYILFIIDKFAGAKRIIDEITIVK